MKAEVEQVSQELDKMNGEILKLIDDESAKAGATRARCGRDAGGTDRSVAAAPHESRGFCSQPEARPALGEGEP